MKKKKAPVRWVRVDMGCGLAENWYTARVIDERKVSRLFDDGLDTELLVEVAGERHWVSSWEEIADAG